MRNTMTLNNIMLVTPMFVVKTDVVGYCKTQLYELMRRIRDGHSLTMIHNGISR